MKKLVFIAASVFAVISQVSARSINDPDFKGSEKFFKTFPKASSVHSVVINHITEVQFALDGRSFKAFYDLDGSFIGTSRQLTIVDLPLRFQMELQDQFQEYVPEEIVEFDEAENGLKYFASVKGKKKSFILEISAQGVISIFKTLRNE